MPKLRISRIVIACAAAGLLAACDNGGEDTAQAELEVEVDESALTGTLLRDLAGTPIPDVTVVDPDGNELALAGMGEPVLVNMWATWCAPCVVEMPLLDELAADLDGQVRVLTVSMDIQGEEAVVPFFEERGLPNLPRWMDPLNELAFAFEGGAVLPLTVLYDADGNEVWRVVGAYHWGSAEARELVLEAVAAAPASTE